MPRLVRLMELLNANAPSAVTAWNPAVPGFSKGTLLLAGDLLQRHSAACIKPFVKNVFAAWTSTSYCRTAIVSTNWIRSFASCRLLYEHYRIRVSTTTSVRPCDLPGRVTVSER